MEKFLFGAYLSVLAAFITAAISIVKLVNEKESKTTDYRQSWTDSARNALSQLIGSMALQASHIQSRTEISHRLISIHETTSTPEDAKSKDSVTKLLSDSYSDINNRIMENRQNIQRYYALTTLHFKPNDEVFSRIEQKYDQIEKALQDLAGANDKHQDADRRELKEKILTATNELTHTSRHILKTEWEHVKAGEPAYKIIKAWSQYVGIGTFAILVFCGIYMLAYTQIQSGNTSQGIASQHPSQTDNTEKSEKIANIQPTPIQQLISFENSSCAQISNQSTSTRPATRKLCNQHEAESTVNSTLK
jgi:uncharacterized protein YdcH (DUF465 family)